MPKTYIHWVAEHAPSKSPVHVREARLFNSLFTCENPAAHDNFVDFINPRSREILHGAMIEVGFYQVARMSLETAKREAEERVKQAVKQTEEALGKDRAHEARDTNAIQSTESHTYGKECIRFQAMRVGYFAVDSDSSMSLFGDREDESPDDLVLNRIVSLKEDVGKSKS